MSARFSGVALAVNLGAAAFSGFVPLVATWPFRATGRVDAASRRPGLPPLSHPPRLGAR